MYLCVSYDTIGQKPHYFLKHINWLIYIQEAEYALCEIGTEFYMQSKVHQSSRIQAQWLSWIIMWLGYTAYMYKYINQLQLNKERRILYLFYWLLMNSVLKVIDCQVGSARDKNSCHVFSDRQSSYYLARPLWHRRLCLSASARQTCSFRTVSINNPRI